MCQRTRLFTDNATLATKLAVPAVDWRASWNIGPGQELLGVLYENGARIARRMRWGWSPTPETAFNIEAENIEAAPAWQQGQRCLVVTDGYYEWRAGEGWPYAVARMKKQISVMAGLWDAQGCVIVTTPSNDLLETVNPRMPAILPEADWPAWLGETPSSPEALKALLKTYPPDDIILWPVHKRVNDLANNDETLCAPVAPSTRVHA